jgi:periplasmic protein TonB
MLIYPSNGANVSRSPYSVPGSIRLTVTVWLPPAKGRPRVVLAWLTAQLAASWPKDQRIAALGRLTVGIPDSLGTARPARNRSQPVLENPHSAGLRDGLPSPNQRIQAENEPPSVATCGRLLAPGECVMFDLVMGKATHTPHHAGVHLVISTTIHLTVVSTLAMSLLVVTEQLPEAPVMMAFVTAPAPPPPPPPARRRAETRNRPAAQHRPIASAEPDVAPVIAPARIEPEPAFDLEGGEEGLTGGIEGGIPGGVVSAVTEGLVAGAPPPPPPPAPRAPVRVGGQLHPPTLLHQVKPVYPEVAVRARVEGVVILEATVDERGRVIDVRLLKPAHRFLDGAAVSAVEQWQYAPLLLNGHPTRFVLTLTLAFRLEDRTE